MRIPQIISLKFKFDNIWRRMLSSIRVIREIISIKKHVNSQIICFWTIKFELNLTVAEIEFVKIKGIIREIQTNQLRLLQSWLKFLRRNPSESRQILWCDGQIKVVSAIAVFSPDIHICIIPKIEHRKCHVCIIWCIGVKKIHIRTTFFFDSSCYIIATFILHPYCNIISESICCIWFNTDNFCMLYFGLQTQSKSIFGRNVHPVFLSCKNNFTINYAVGTCFEIIGILQCRNSELSSSCR